MASGAHLTTQIGSRTPGAYLFKGRPTLFPLGAKIAGQWFRNGNYYVGDRTIYQAYGRPEAYSRDGR